MRRAKGRNPPHNPVPGSALSAGARQPAHDRGDVPSLTLMRFWRRIPAPRYRGGVLIVVTNGRGTRSSALKASAVPRMEKRA